MCVVQWAHCVHFASALFFFPLCCRPSIASLRRLPQPRRAHSRAGRSGPPAQSPPCQSASRQTKSLSSIRPSDRPSPGLCRLPIEFAPAARLRLFVRPCYRPFREQDRERDSLRQVTCRRIELGISPCSGRACAVPLMNWKRAKERPGRKPFWP